MTTSELARANAARRSVEVKKQAKLPPTVVDWDAAIDRLKVMLAQMYRPRPQRGGSRPAQRKDR